MERQGALLVRTDASREIGFGHFVRTFALSQAWRERGGEVTYLMAEGAPQVSDWLEAEGIGLRFVSAAAGSRSDAYQTLHLARQEQADWVVLDGYQFTSDFQKWIKQGDARLLCVDDNMESDHYYADLVLNQNLHARYCSYLGREPYTEFLLGPAYSLLRKHFLRWRQWRRDIPRCASRILVTMGGSDADNVTSLVLRAIGSIHSENVETKVVVGPGNRHLQSINLAASRARGPVSVLTGVTEMAELMSWADVIVSGAGSSCWESCFMGCPMLLITVAENQQRIAGSLARSGAAMSIGWHSRITSLQLAESLAGLIENQSLRGALSRRAKALVDGLGASRVAEALAAPKPQLAERMSCA